MIEQSLTAEQALMHATVTDQLNRMQKQHADIGTCWASVGGKVLHAETPGPFSISPRAVQALLLDMPSRPSGSDPGAPWSVELKYGERTSLIYECGSVIVFVDLPTGSRARKSLSRAIKLVFRYTDPNGSWARKQREKRPRSTSTRDTL